MPFLSRRTLLAASGALPFAPAAARAKAGQVVVGESGAAYTAALEQIIDRDIVVPMKIGVQHHTAPVAALARTVADARRDAAGPLDVVCLPDVDMYILSLLDPFRFVTATDVPNLTRALPSLRAPYAVPHFASALVLLYDRTRTKTPPRSWAELWNTKWRGAVGMSDSLDFYTMAAATLGAGGRLDNYGPGLAKLAQARANGARLYPDTEALGAALRAGQIALCPALRSHGYVWGRAAANIGAVAPGEGAIPYVQMAAVPRNAPEPADGLLYLNALLQRPAQRSFAEQFGAIPSVSGVDLPNGLLGAIGLSPDAERRLQRPHYDYLAQSAVGLRQKWSALFAG